MSFINSEARQKMHPVNSADLLSSATRNYGYYPLIRGNKVPAFYLNSENGFAKHLASGSLANEERISIEDFLDNQQPLVIVFIGQANSAQPDIKALKSLQADIQVMGGRLLVLSSIAPKYLRKLLKNQDNLTVFYDKENTIAELFGLYDVANPLWQWIAGVEEEDVPLPAFYVVTPDRQIAYHHIDYTLSVYSGAGFITQPFVRDLLTSVYHTAQQYSYQPIQYKKVV
jgi:hypothetical protein